MNATHGPRASTPTAFDRVLVGGAGLAFIDVRLRSILREFGAVLGVRHR